MREEHYGDRKEVHRFVLSVVAMRVSNPDRSPAGINR